MGAYSSVLKANKIFQSMSRKGNCYDNSVMENFFGILKQKANKREAWVDESGTISAQYLGCIKIA